MLRKWKHVCRRFMKCFHLKIQACGFPAARTLRSLFFRAKHQFNRKKLTTLFVMTRDGDLNSVHLFICYRNRSLSLELQTTMNVGGGSKQSKKILAVDATLKENLKNASNAWTFKRCSPEASGYHVEATMVRMKLMWLQRHLAVTLGRIIRRF